MNAPSAQASAILLACALLAFPGCHRPDPLKGSISDEEVASKPDGPTSAKPLEPAAGARYGHSSFWEPPEAVEMLTERARQGDAQAQYWMGYLHENGLKGVSKDRDAALDFYRLAAEQDHERAKLGVERLSAKADGEAADPARAEKDAAVVTRLKQAAERGHPESLYLLGYYYEHGRYGLEKNISLAKDCYQKAAEQGHEKAAIALERVQREE